MLSRSHAEQGATPFSPIRPAVHPPAPGGQVAEHGHNGFYSRLPRASGLVAESSRFVHSTTSLPSSKVELKPGMAIATNIAVPNPTPQSHDKPFTSPPFALPRPVWNRSRPRGPARVRAHHRGQPFLARCFTGRSDFIRRRRPLRQTLIASVDGISIAIFAKFSRDPAVAT